MRLEDEVKKVVVNGYTYETDLDVQLGDRVVLPGRGKGTWTGTVQSFESSYTGPCKQILSIVPRFEPGPTKCGHFASKEVTLGKDTVIQCACLLLISKHERGEEITCAKCKEVLSSA